MENITSLEAPPELKAIIDKFSPFLAEVRKRIVFTFSLFVIATIAGFFFYEHIIRFLIEILGLKGVNVVFTSPFQFINLAVSCGIATGVVVSFPLIIFQILSFLRPALKGKEYNTLVKLLPLSLFLFLLGFSFGAIIMTWQIQIFLSKSISLGIGNILDISRLLSTIILTSVFMGVSLQFPIVLMFLMRLGLVKHEQLSRVRRWIYLASFIFALFLPPDSILADVILAMPIILLFELTLFMSRKKK